MMTHLWQFIEEPLINKFSNQSVALILCMAIDFKTQNGGSKLMKRSAFPQNGYFQIKNHLSPSYYDYLLTVK